MKETGSARPRVVLVTRPSEYQALLESHGTREQARFFLATRGQEIEELEERHREFEEALAVARKAVPVRWRFVHVDRHDLATFVFEPPDLVLVVGQDGLVANAAKYLEGQLVVGVNPAPDRYPGLLVPHRPAAVAAILRAWRAERVDWEERTMVEARLDDGQRLVALNELFVGHCSHQSARYRIACREQAEEQSSSGLIVSTGTGGTGWALSISRARTDEVPLPSPGDRRVVFFVREAWPSPATGASLVSGTLEEGGSLEVTSRMNDGGVIFGDGIEADRLAFNWGHRAELAVALDSLRLVRGI